MSPSKVFEPVAGLLLQYLQQFPIQQLRIDLPDSKCRSRPFSRRYSIPSISEAIKGEGQSLELGSGARRFLLCRDAGNGLGLAGLTAGDDAALRLDETGVGHGRSGIDDV